MFILRSGDEKSFSYHVFQNTLCREDVIQFIIYSYDRQNNHVLCKTGLYHRKIIGYFICQKVQERVDDELPLVNAMLSSATLSG